MFKKITSIILAFVIIFSVAIPTAAEKDNTVTEKNVIAKISKPKYFNKKIVYRAENLKQYTKAYMYFLSQGAAEIQFVSKNSDVNFEKIYNDFSYYDGGYRDSQFAHANSGLITDYGGNFDIYFDKYDHASQTYIGNTVAAFVMAYRYNDKTALKLINENQKTKTLYKKCVQILNDCIDPKKNDKENMQAIINWLSDNVKYDKYDDNGGWGYEAYGAIVDNLAVCSGYSHAFNLLMRMAGMKCWYISGYAPNQQNTPRGEYPYHGWNAYIMDGVLYFCDVTNYKIYNKSYTYKEMINLGYRFGMSKELTFDDLAFCCKY